MNTITLRSAAALSIVIVGAPLTACAPHTSPEERAERSGLVAYRDVAERREWMRETSTVAEATTAYQDQAERRRDQATADPSEPPDADYLDQAERRLRQAQVGVITGH